MYKINCVSVCSWAPLVSRADVASAVIHDGILHNNAEET